MTERYELSDARLRPLLFSGFILAVLVAAAMAASAWMSQSATEALADEERMSPLRDLRKPSTRPELSSIPARELELHREWENAMLTGTEWVDPLNQIVRIPIEDAMRLALSEGFPVREEKK